MEFDTYSAFSVQTWNVNQTKIRRHDDVSISHQIELGAQLCENLDCNTKVAANYSYL